MVDRKKLQDALQAAIEAVIEEYRNDDDGIVADWACVVQTAGFDANGDGLSAYYLLYSGGEMPEHRLVGLWTYGIHLVTNGRKVDDEG